MENQVASLSLPDGGHAIEKVGTLPTQSKSPAGVAKENTKTFTCFKKLPAEMHKRIWEEASTVTRVVVLELAGCGGGHFRFYEEFNNLTSLPSALLETSFESRDAALRKCQHACASSFRCLHPSCYEGDNGVDPYAPDSDASDSDDPEYQPYRKPVFDLQPSVPFTETDCLYLCYYLFDYDNPTPISFLPANLKLRTIHRVALQIDVIEEKFFRFIKCFM
jgi:hypothetical protein